jgi:hypothetical protein
MYGKITLLEKMQRTNEQLNDRQKIKQRVQNSAKK